VEKRYQVFVSSTYDDLREERQEVMQALLELDCIPSGMELFPAADEDQWTLIKRVIDDCDYYLVILGGRYGTLGPDGVSYTEQEYRYALERGKPIIAFVHKDPGSLPAKRTEASEEGRQKLRALTALVQKKMCRFWESPADLGSQVSRSLVKLIKDHPGIGWVRGDHVSSEAAALEALRMRGIIETLEAELAKSRTIAPEGTSELAQGDDLLELTFTFEAYDDEEDEETRFESKCAISWNDLFATLSPLMIQEASTGALHGAVTDLVKHQEIEELAKRKQYRHQELRSFAVPEGDLHTVLVQLRALGLIVRSEKTRSVKDTASYWTLTPFGDTVMTRLRAIRKGK
jgi:hypothetical protein